MEKIELNIESNEEKILELTRQLEAVRTQNAQLVADRVVGVSSFTRLKPLKGKKLRGRKVRLIIEVD